MGLGVRTVAAWHQKWALRLRPEMQLLLDTALGQASQPSGTGSQYLPTGPPGQSCPPQRSNEGLFALMQRLRQFKLIGEHRADIPDIEWTVRS
jgi:hypothetical protein